MKLSKARASFSSNLKVTVYWGDILYDTVYCSPKEQVTVGRAANNTVVVPLEGTAKREQLELIKVNEDNSVDLLFDESIQGHVRLGKEFHRLHGLIENRKAIKETDGLYRIRMGEKDEADLVVGHVSFYLTWTSERIVLPKTAVREQKTNILIGSLATLLLLIVVGVIQMFELPPPEPPPERLVKIASKKPPPKPAKAAVGQKKKLKKDGGASKKPAGKKKLVTKPKLSEAERLQKELSGDLVKDLADIGTMAPNRAKTVDNAAQAAIDQAGTGGFSTEGFKTGAGGKSKGLGRTVGQGEGGFAGTGKLGLAGNSVVEGSSKYGAVETVTEGGLDRDVIDQIVRKRKARIRLCYERQLNFTLDLAGKVTVHFVIGANGKVVKRSIAEDTMASAPVNQCILSEVKTWIFPRPKGGTLVNVDYPFVFESSVK